MVPGFSPVTPRQVGTPYGGSPGPPGAYPAGAATGRAGAVPGARVRRLAG